MSMTPWNRVSQVTAGKVGTLQEGYTAKPRSAVAQRTLADLRHADANDPAANPALWEVVLGGLPEDLAGSSDDPTWAESAIHAALVLYAIHQQSRTEPMHRVGVGLGTAVRDLSRKRASESWDPGTISRFHALSRAQSPAMRLYHLRGLVSLMRAESVPLDYGLLAADLWLLNTGSSDRVRLRWGRQLHHYSPLKSESTATTTEGDAS